MCDFFFAHGYLISKIVNPSHHLSVPLTKSSDCSKGTRDSHHAGIYNSPVARWAPGTDATTPECNKRVEAKRVKNQHTLLTNYSNFR